MLDWLEYIDTKFFLLLNGFHSPFFDNLMPWLSGNILWIPFYGWLIYFLYRALSRKQFVWAIVALGTCVAITDLISFHLVKETIQRYRPCHNLEIQSLVHVVDKCGGLHGFVSSHAANVFGIAMLHVGHYCWVFKNLFGSSLSSRYFWRRIIGNAYWILML